MRVAILGAGFCGLAVACHLIKKNIRDIIIFDPLEIGRGTSGVAAGLLHPYAGSQAKKNIRADEGMIASHELFRLAETTLKSQVIIKKGLIRLAVSDKQKKDFAAVAAQYPDVHWLSVEECQQKLKGILAHPGILIDSAVVIDCEKYLQGLSLTCLQEGVIFEKKKIASLAVLSDFDHVVVAMGAASKSLPELSDIKLTPIKGQVLELCWPGNQEPLALPISSQAYTIMQPGNKTCIAGATFERHFSTLEPDLPTAINEIIPKLQDFLPLLNESLVVDCRTGVRASAPKHQPMMGPIDTKNWILTGMGSKGLLYHALYAKELVQKMLQT